MRQGWEQKENFQGSADSDINSSTSFIWRRVLN